MLLAKRICIISGRRWRGRSIDLRSRCFAAAAPADDAEALAAQILEYAASARRKGGAGHLDAIQVLEHGVSFVSSRGPSGATALSKIQLLQASVLADYGKVLDATELLHSVSSNEAAGLDARVSALEALAALYMQIHEDELASAQVQAMSKLATSDPEIRARSQGLAALINLAESQFDAAASYAKSFSADTKQGTAILARAEVAHVTGDDEQAKKFYERAAALAKDKADKSGLAVITSAEVQTAALAGLGQLSTDLGHFDEAEKNLTGALQLAESINGEAHARVGLVLSCMANLYSRRASAENSGFLIPEGLFRKSLDLLKAPSLDKEPSDKLQYLDATVITRARYADILCKANQRAAEGERIKSWASSAWRNKRSLSDLLKGAAANEDKSKLRSILDVRLGRVF